MLGLSIDGYTVAAIVVVVLGVVALAVIVERVLRDRGVRVTRVGVFVERERIDEVERVDRPNE